VEKNIGKVGMRQVNTAVFEAPKPIVAAWHKPPRTQLRESIPWLVTSVFVHPGQVGNSYSKSSPNGEEVPVLRACFPSRLSIVEYLIHRSAISDPFT